MTCSEFTQDLPHIGCKSYLVPEALEHGSLKAREGGGGCSSPLKSSKAPGKKKLVIWLEHCVTKKRWEDELGGSSRLERTRSGVFKTCLEVTGASQLQDF